LSQGIIVFYLRKPLSLPRTIELTSAAPNGRYLKLLDQISRDAKYLSIAIIAQ
jgi:hypothetical protein